MTVPNGHRRQGTRRALPTRTRQQLAERAAAASQRAYAPYSRFKVGAAVLASSGTIYDGCNVENAAFPLCLCAERTALCAAVAAGEKSFEAICVHTNNSPPASPCGACRQVMAELGPDMVVLLCNPSGQVVRTSVAALLPLAFGGQMLKAARARPARRGKSSVAHV